jgi:hypothetical protein
VRATERADDLWKQVFSKLTMALSGELYPAGLLVSPENARIFDVNIVRPFSARTTTGLTGETQG